jgi:hypothetical protein
MAATTLDTDMMHQHITRRLLLAGLLAGVYTTALANEVIQFKQGAVSATVRGQVVRYSIDVRASDEAQGDARPLGYALTLTIR